ncbi:MAG: hypothetical protein V4714_04965 [Bacteroidota bacterium]
MYKSTITGICFLLLLTLLGLRTVSAQVLPIKLNITVLPPYPVSVSYYADHPEQVVFQVINLSNTEQHFRLSGSLIGLDNNVKIVAKENAASGIITLSPLETRLLTASEIQELFDGSKMAFTGINYRKTQIDDGLPEGLYNVCAYAVEAAHPTFLLSDNTCSNAFQVTNLEPPMIISPMADALVPQTLVQTLLFTWTLPASASPNTEYTLRMAEIWGNMNANNALQSATQPAFFERTVTANTLLYGPGDPTLVPGRKYAYMVTAKDPFGKAVFRNGGRSAVQVFQYGTPLVSTALTLTNQSDEAGDLFFTFPNCQKKVGEKSVKEDPQRIFTDEDTPVSLTWLWGIQTDPKKDFFSDPSKITYQGASIQRYEVVIRKVSPGQKSSVFAQKKTVKAPNEYLQFSFAEAMQAGMLDSAVYVADLTAFDNQNKSLIKVSSCRFTLRKIPTQGIPNIALKGKLKYKFKNDPSPYPANNVSMTVSYAPVAKPGVLPKKAYFTTDKEGNFAGEIERDTGVYNLQFTINSPYYKNSLADLKVNLNTFKKDTLSDKITQTGSQKTLLLGELTTQVYSYDLTVNVGKGFPKFTADGSSQEIVTGSLDTLTVSPGAKVKDGIPVQLYRKSKPASVPFYENGIQITDFVSGKNVLVAEGKTATEINSFGKPFSVVRFKNLVINFLPGDEYYLKAIIQSGQATNYTPTGNNNQNPLLNPASLGGIKTEDDEELTGPEMRVVFGNNSSAKNPKGKDKNTSDTQSQATGKYHFEQTISYALISTTPPISHIKGRIVYSWPSEPSVIRPLRNSDITVKIGYLCNGVLYPMMEGDKCAFTTHSLFKPGAKVNADGSNAKPEDALSIPDLDFVVGVGKTDNNGNFELKIINHNKKGLVYPNAVFSSKTTVSGLSGCVGEKEVYKPTKQSPKQKIQEKIDAVVNPSDAFMQHGTPVGGDVMNFTDGVNPVAGGSDWFTNAGITTDKTFQAGAKGGLGNQKLDFGQAQLDMGTIEMTTPAPDKQGIPGLNKTQGGPANDVWEVEAYETPTTNVERVFVISANKGYLDGAFTSNGNMFVLKAFETKDFGTIKMVVHEETKRTVKVKGSGQDAKVDFSNARLVIYRPNSPSKLDKAAIPEGEGSSNHPIKPLNPVSFEDKLNDGTPVEWILDHTIPCDSTGNFDLSNLKLLRNGKNYRMQVSADPAQTGARFEAVDEDFQKDELEVVISNSRIAGRLYDKSSGKGISGNVKVTDGFKGQYTQSTVDTSGYFEFGNAYYEGFQPGKSISLSPMWTDNQSVTLEGSAAGYKNSEKKSFKVQKKGMNYFSAVQLEPSGLIVGNARNEENKPLAVYIQREDSSVFSDLSTTPGFFAVKVPDVTQKITFLPKDPAYFDSTITVNGPFGTRNLKTIVFFKRKHRIQFNLAFYQVNGEQFTLGNVGLLKGRFKVTVNNEQAKTYYCDEKGIVQIAFENVSVNNYNILIEDKLGDFIPISFNLKNEESKGWKVYPIKLKQGTYIRGVVTLDGKLVKNAKVYADVYGSSSGNNAETAYNTLQTKTLANGSYMLKNLPTGGVTLKIRAVLDTTFAVNGSSQLINMNNIPKSVDFNLQKMGDFAVKDLFGFPVSVETITQNKSDSKTFLVTGLVDLSKANIDFGWLDPNTKIRVKNVLVAIKNGKAVADVDKIELSATPGFKMKYQGQYNVYVAGGPDKTKPQDLSLTRTAKGGYLLGYTSITDNSFNYPSTYLDFGKNNGQEDFFYLGSLGNQGNVQMQNRVLATDGSSATNYRLCNKEGHGLAFNFIGFKTIADPKNSFPTSTGDFQLDVNVTGNLIYSNQTQAVSFRIPNLLLNSTSIKQAHGDVPLAFKLQEWTLEVRDWTMDPQKGGLVSEKCLIKTGVVDIKAARFNLRHDLLVLDKFDTKEILLGGGMLKLEEVSQNAFLVFDERCGSDLQGHWRLAITGDSKGMPAAKIKNLQPFTNEEINIDFIQMISYNKGKDNLISLGQNKAMQGVFSNKYLSFVPRFIASNPDNFSLTGDLNFDIPRVSGSAATVKFTNANGQKADLQPISTEFEGLGYVRFTADTQKPGIDAQQVMTLAGTVVEPGKFNPLPCVFRFGNNQTPRIFLPNSPEYNAAKNSNAFNYQLSLVSTGNEGSKLLLNGDKDRNGMWVEPGSKDWNNLRFSGTLEEDAQHKGLMSKPLTLDFVVYGELQANSDKVEINDIDTPLGKMQMVYNFEKKELVGSMQMLGVKFGSYTADADVESRIGASGFLLSGAASVNTGTLLVNGFGTIKMGFALGNYSLDNSIIQRVKQFSLDQNNCWLKGNSSKFKGLYLTGGYNILDEKIVFDAVLVSAYVHAALGVEASFGLNKNVGTNAMLRVGVYGKVDAGLEAITGTSISGDVNANISIDGAYNSDPDTYTLGGDANLTLSVKVKQSLVVTTLEAGFDLGAGMKVKYSNAPKGFDFDFYLGEGATGVPTCE